MKNKTTPTLLILIAFVLAYLSAFLPATNIRYQITVEPSQSNGLSIPQTTWAEGYTSAFSSTKDGRNVFPCDIGVRWYAPDSSFVWLYSAWQMVGRVLWFCGFGMGLVYAAERKMPLGLFFISLILLAAIPIAIMESLPTPEVIWCDQSTYYKAISFTPYWPVVLIWVSSASLALYGRRLHKISTLKISPIEIKEN